MAKNDQMVGKACTHLTYLLAFLLFSYNLVSSSSSRTNSCMLMSVCSCMYMYNEYTDIIFAAII